MYHAIRWSCFWQGVTRAVLITQNEGKSRLPYLSQREKNERQERSTMVIHLLFDNSCFFVLFYLLVLFGPVAVNIVAGEQYKRNPFTFFFICFFVLFLLWILWLENSTMAIHLRETNCQSRSRGSQKVFGSDRSSNTFNCLCFIMYLKKGPFS